MRHLPPDGTACQVAAEPALVAWALASLCRDAHPASDPLPINGPVPVLRTRRDAFRVVIASDGAGAPYRCEMNGRLAAPIAVVHDDGRMSWRAPEFLPAGRHTVASGGGDRVEIAIEPSAGGDSHVTFAFGGVAASEQLIERLTAAVEVLTAARQTDLLLLGDAPARAAIVGYETLTRLEARQVTGLGPLLAPLYAHLAAARLRLGDLTDARHAASAAVATAPGVASLRVALADLDSRLARTRDAARAMRVLARDPLGGPIVRIAAERARNARAVERNLRAAGPMLAHARALLGAGDLEGAAAWSRTARTCGDQEFGGIDIELARARGDHRTAFALGVERLLRFGFDADLVLALAADADAYGDPAAGLRLVTRHWSALRREHREDALAAARRLAMAAGPDLAARVALAEDNEAVAYLVLRSATPAGTAHWVSAPRLASLRALTEHASAPRPIATDGFELAPGVAPLR